MRTVSYFRILNPMQHLFRRIDGSENIEVFDRNHFFPQQRVADPVEQALPVFLSDENDWKRFYLPLLDQRNRFGLQVSFTARQHAGGTKHGDGRRYLSERLESFNEFRHDPEDPPGILTGEVIYDVLLFDAISLHAANSPKKPL